MKIRNLLMVLVILGVITQAGCSNFKASKRLNLAPFAEDMIAVAGDIQYGLGQTYSVYLHGYDDTPEAARLLVISAKVRLLIRNAISYALEVVALADSRLSGSERTLALSQKIEDLVRPVIQPPTAALNISEAQLDTLVARVRDSKNLLDGLGAAQPIINEVARLSGEIFEDTKNALDEAVAATQREIENDIAPVLAQDALMRDFQWRGVRAIEMIVRYRAGDTAALDTLIVLAPGLSGMVATEDGLTIKELAVTEERILFGLQTISDVRDQLKPDVELYWKQQAELEEITASFNTALRQARVAMIAWSRAHQRLASGITDPAEIDIFGLAKKAAGDFLPIP